MPSAGEQLEVRLLLTCDAIAAASIPMELPAAEQTLYLNQLGAARFSTAIDLAGDVDAFRFYVEPEGSYTIQTTGNTNTVLGYWDDAGTTRDDCDDDSGPLPANALLVEMLTQGAINTIAVGEDGGDATGNYVIEIDGPSADEVTILSPINAQATGSGAISSAQDYDFFLFTGQSNGWYRVTAERASGNVDPQLMLYDDAGTPLAYYTDPGTFRDVTGNFTTLIDHSATGVERAWYSLESGEQYWLRVEGAQATSGDYAVEVSRTAHLTERIVNVNGSALDDTFMYQELGGDYVIHVDGFEDRFSVGAVDAIRIRGYSGSDTAIISGRPGVEEYPVLTSGGGLVQRQGVQLIEIINTETTYFYGQQEDGGQLLDSPANTLFVSSGSYAYVSGVDDFRLISGVSNVYGYSTSGSGEQAWHYGTPGTDSYVASGSAYTYMSGAVNGNGFFNVSVGFAVSYGFSGNETAGDIAYFLDSPGNDTFYSQDSATGDYAYMSGPGFFNVAQDFEGIFAQSFVGGSDTAYNFAPHKTVLSGFDTVFTNSDFAAAASSDASAASSSSGTNDFNLVYSTNTAWRPAEEPEDEDDLSALDELMSDDRAFDDVLGTAIAAA